MATITESSSTLPPPTDLGTPSTPNPDFAIQDDEDTKTAVDSPGSDPLSSSNDEDDERRSRSRSRQPRPRFLARKSSTIVVPRDHPHIDLDLEIDPEEFKRNHEFAPDDARAMSPRRSSSDLARLGEGVRESLVAQSRTLQSSLAALAQRIEVVRNDHVKLEKENKLLQDYIGGLTRNMAAAGTSSSGLGKGRKL
ncbi:MAG: hypothetical protein M1834_007703 [Cirrosporium novae-zelandiae]|nr:MAG: hypothetical protein M1834_007703 [Cirrosporium novae-zelandiae]